MKSTYHKERLTKYMIRHPSITKQIPNTGAVTPSNKNR